MPRKATPENNLAVHFPEVAKQWHPTKNEKGADEYLPKSNKKVWWICPSCNNDFYGLIAERTKGSWCKPCGTKSGAKKVAKSKEQFLRELKAIWGNEYELMGEYKSGKTKIDVKHTLCGAVYAKKPDNLLSGRGCKYCQKKEASKEYNLDIAYPEKAIFFYEEKNNLKSSQILPFSNKKVWWKCNSGHIWKETVSNRVHSVHNCPYCDKQRPSKEYNLLVVNPELAAEWNFEKNETRPDDFLPISNEIVHWKCICSKEWSSSISNRAKGKGCPRCNESKGEKEIRKILDNMRIEYVQQKKFDECKSKRCLPFDFYVPSKNTLIEFQGIQHFQTTNGDFFGGKKALKERQDNDSIKRNFAKNKNINLLEIRYDQFNEIKQILFNVLS